jgi:predicted Rossmann fold flavoprotein
VKAPADDIRARDDSTHRLVVIGGGAAGFFCAVNAARMNNRLEVILVEKSGKWLNKVKVSGGGRCNVTHDSPSIDAMIDKYPRGSRFLRNSFHHFFKDDTVNWFSERGIRLKTEADGRMFPVSDSSQTIIDCLLEEAEKYRVSLMLHREVKKIECTSPETATPPENAEVLSGRNIRKFRVWIMGDQLLEADYVCICCGGFPKMSQYEWITRLGHSIEPPVPSLFTFNIPGHPIVRLQGISVPHARVSIKGTTFQEAGPLLITHWGLSGPSVLRLSAYAAVELHQMQYEFGIRVNWNPAYNEQTADQRILEWREVKGAARAGAKNDWSLPERLWEFLLDQSAVLVETKWAELTASQRHQLVKNLCSFSLQVSGKTTFKEEFVTAGGVRLNEIDPHTMESKKLSGLYLAGEILNVDGITGGFNFQHAWTSGWLAAQSIASRARGELAP